MSIRTKYNSSSPHAEIFIGALIGLGLAGFIPLIIGSKFLFGSPFFYLTFVIGIIGFILCMDGIRRL